MQEFVTVMADLLVRAVATVSGKGALEKIPAFAGFGEIRCGDVRIFLFEQRRRSCLGERGDGGGGDSGGFRKYHLGIATVRENVVFVRAVTGINQEVKTAVG